MRDDRTIREEAWERRTELPLFYASLVFIASYAVRVLATGASPVLRDVALSLTGLTWACFLTDYLVRMALSRRRPLAFVRRHWLDTVVVFLPQLRPLRVVKLHDAVQAKVDRPRRELHVRVIMYAGLAGLLLGFSGALAVYDQERGAPGASIRTFGDSVWWV
ncbi:potassium channel family protein [Streptomyces sp. NPDC054838]